MLQDMMQSFQDLGLTPEQIAQYCEKLVEYRPVDQIQVLQKGRHIRWIRLTGGPYVLTNGGIIVDIRFLDTGTSILCKNGARFMQIPFDDCLLFQKLSYDELLLLHCYSMME